MLRTFVAEIKEREAGEPCFLWINTTEDIGLGGRSITINLPSGTGYAEAKELRDALHKNGGSFRLA
jgi:hypothetical protein